MAAGPRPYLKGSTYGGANQISIRGDLAAHCSRIKSLRTKPLEIHLSSACKILLLQANPRFKFPPPTRTVGRLVLAARHSASHGGGQKEVGKGRIKKE